MSPAHNDAADARRTDDLSTSTATATTTASDLSGPPEHPTDDSVLQRLPVRGVFGTLLAAVVVWYLFIFDTAANNDVIEGFRTLIDGFIALPELVSDGEAYSNWWSYLNDQEGWSPVLGHTVDHIQLVGMSMLFATLISIGLGIAIHRRRELRGPVMGLASVLITIPSLALFAIFISVPGIGIGDRGPIIALVLYSILPILRNTITGLEGVDRAVIESARGMGLNARQRLLRVELPLAWPVILTGMRVATLLNIGIAAISVLVGGTGLGVYINDGLQRFPNVTSVERMWTGVIFTIAVALVADLVFTLVRRLTTSKGLPRVTIHDETSSDPLPDAHRDGATPSSAPNTMIQLEGVGKIYPGTDVPAVADLYLEIPEGEILVLVGPSGCGKSTTLRLINRMIEPTSGRIIFDGDDVTDVNPDELRRRIGYVIQQIGLFPHQTIAQNIATVPKLLGWDKRRISARVDELLEVTGLDPSIYRDRYPKELSGGQAQRVGVARALGADPEVLLMDEPFGAIDPITRDRLQNEFLRLQGELKKTIVFVTHDIDEAIKMGDRIAILGEQSVIRQFDTPERILAYPVDDFVGDFIGSGSTLKGLNFERVRDLALNDTFPVVDVNTDPAEARRRFDASPERWMLVLDAEQRPIRWVDDKILSDTSTPLGESGPVVRATVLPNATLHDALEELLMSNAGQAVVIDERRRYQGIVDVGSLADVLKRMRTDAQKHYEDLAAKHAADDRADARAAGVTS